MNIIQNLTLTNYNKMTNKQNKYIVVHYVGAVSTAQNNGIYFKNTYRGASAHYFVDDNEIVQVVTDKDRAWHCGDYLKKGCGGKYYGKCTNDNSIGIEMCCYMNNGKLDISEKTIANTIELVKELMAKYNIPSENVIRHYDVTNKICPAPFVADERRWIGFKNKLGQTTAEVQPKPAQKAPKKIDVKYQVYVNGKWLEDVVNFGDGADGYAGIYGRAITGLRANTVGKEEDAGKLIYRVHTLRGKWLDEVTDREKDKNGDDFAGILGKYIDGIMIKSTKGKSKYRVHLINGTWLPWVTGYNTSDVNNGYAGNLGHAIDGIQIEII